MDFIRNELSQCPTGANNGSDFFALGCFGVRPNQLALAKCRGPNLMEPSRVPERLGEVDNFPCASIVGLQKA